MIKSMPLKWHGGKQPLAKWLHSLAPASYTHRNIVFGGGLGEFWNWLPIEGISEAVNDTDRELIILYSVIRSSEWFGEFQRRVSLIPFSDGAFWNAATCNETYVQMSGVAVDRASSFFIKYRQSRQGLGKDYATPTKRTRRGMNENVSAWLSAVDGLQDCHERLRRVEIRNMDCIDFIKKYDHEKALFYCDPPYLHETRSTVGEYGQHEMSVEQHKDLLNCLESIKGKFMLSGYRSELYNLTSAHCGWTPHEYETTNKASSSKTKEKRIECCWTNYPV